MLYHLHQQMHICCLLTSSSNSAKVVGAFEIKSCCSTLGISITIAPYVLPSVVTRDSVVYLSYYLHLIYFNLIVHLYRGFLRDHYGAIKTSGALPDWLSVKG